MEELKKFGIPECDIAQTIEAEQVLKCKVDGKPIGKAAALEHLGGFRYWNGVHRAAFHWTGIQFDDAKREYYFDCRSFFRD